MHRRPLAWEWVVVRVVGAGLLIATGAIHLDLYLTGYRTIPTIGWLFLLQVVTALCLGAIVLVTAKGPPMAAGAVFALSTLGGYLLSLRIGLFGFREVRTTAGIVAGIIEVATFAALAPSALRASAFPKMPSLASRKGRLAGNLRARLPAVYLTCAAVAVLAAAALGASLAAAGPSSAGSASGSSILKIAKVKGVSVITNAQGFTLYWFVPDTPARSTCYGTCAVYWPPLTGSPVAGPGVPAAKLGTVDRSGGVVQATYDGHPLYTYVGDSAMGQANGNDINLNGGLWHEMDASG